ncbi:hypothetical protein AKL17_3573 [Frigidibacter mobilis]|uniref:Uncharacterized protein n=1 Tax=Frigidibacter mobilis TaxID=1335048 RepID=A0A159Z655_9RHOB|nr:hypothetical protein AKL17_3573 [Frigidibacter mobilis]
MLSKIMCLGRSIKLIREGNFCTVQCFKTELAHGALHACIVDRYIRRGFSFYYFARIFHMVSRRYGSRNNYITAFREVL